MTSPLGDSERERHPVSFCPKREKRKKKRQREKGTKVCDDFDQSCSQNTAPGGGDTGGGTLQSMSRLSLYSCLCVTASFNGPYPGVYIFTIETQPTKVTARKGHTRSVTDTAARQGNDAGIV